MIIWLNGPFGVGKTRTAHALQARLPGSFISDPEEIGGALFRTLPAAMRTDFQDLPIWRTAVLEVLRQAASHPAPVIVPMTLVVPAYFDEIIGQLRREGQELHHFALLAPAVRIQQRLKGRGDGKQSWAAQQTSRCLEALQQPHMGIHLQTEGKTITRVAEEVASHVGLDLLPAPSPLKVWQDRFRVQLSALHR